MSYAPKSAMSTRPALAAQKRALGRPTDYDTAWEVIFAVELAQCGASAALLAQLTGFSRRWAREIVRRHQGIHAPAPGDPINWLETDSHRLMEANVFLMMYEVQRSSDSQSRRLLEAYRSYRLVAARQSSPLNVNRCAQLVGLYRNGIARKRACKECKLPRFVLLQRPLCPVCESIRRLYCKACKQQLPESDIGRRAYCRPCAS